ncbi:hypothetical protein, partial [Pseudomonas viridiflava]|uniref:hypothetical protein n=1 Tax=Pseudomonas viridiflava TaxID=33069 RepID=UPI00197F62AC
YKFFILLLPLNEQHEIVARAEKALILLGQLERQLVTAESLATSLSSSILESALNGVLSSEWREQNEATGSLQTSSEHLLNKIKNSHSGARKK